MEVSLRFERHAGQIEVFERCHERKRVIAKGRRWGFTKGAMQYLIELMLEGTGPCFWGDTISVNIANYVERYALPILIKLPTQIWDWKKQEKKLYINGQVCDFRSADQPENWEGFGYKVMILNEAGIILKDSYLWNHAVRPMLMDYPDSIAVIGGTPKGKNLFYELWLKGEIEKGWQSFQYSSYTNPYLSKEEIDELIAELPDSVVRQEIYAEFTDVSAQLLIPYDLIRAALIKEVPLLEDITLPEVWGVDVARHGDDDSVIARRYGRCVYQMDTLNLHDTMQLASKINYEYRQAERKPQHIFIETTGIGWGVYDRCRELGVPAYPADVSLKSVVPGVYNKRAEMYHRLLENLKKELKIIEDRKLIRQLSNCTEFKFNHKSEIQLIDKAEIKKKLGESPDVADAVALTFFEEVGTPAVSPEKRKRYQTNLMGVKGRSWMST